MERVEQSTLQLKAFHQDLQMEVNAKVPLLDAQANYVNRSHFLELMEVFGQSLDNRALQKDVSSMMEYIDKLNNKQVELCNQISIAIRFIDWFTNRGMYICASECIYIYIYVLVSV